MRLLAFCKRLLKIIEGRRCGVLIMDITQENMASLFRFFMTYNELCKSFSNIDLENMYYLVSAD